MKRCGKLSPKWIGNRASFKRIRKGAKWEKWRKAVFERDNYTCQKCGTRSGIGNPVILHPHHILQSAFYPKFRFEIDNGQTLCVPCHKKTPHFLNRTQLSNHLKSKLQEVIDRLSAKKFGDDPACLDHLKQIHKIKMENK